MESSLNYTTLALRNAASCLLSGNLVVFPTETVYGLGADATNEGAVAKIYTIKGRPTSHPLIVHLSSIINLNKWAVDVPDYALILARNFWPGPMTLILPRTKLAKDFITGSQESVGIRIPAHTVALELLKEFESQGGLGVAAPSANKFGKVSPTCVDDVKDELSNDLSPCDLILDGGSSLIGLESTIIDCTKKTPTLLRPGAVTPKMINKVLGGLMKIESKNGNLTTRASGMLASHYSPTAKVFLSGKPEPGDGLIAIKTFQTPKGVVRLASPQNNVDYARVLYQALRLADKKNLFKVFVIPPTGDGIAEAICDRLQKAAKNI